MHLPPAIGQADLHVHPSGDRADGRAADAIYAALRSSGLSIAVLADHDRIDPARDLVARSREEGTSTELVVGEEITTRGGHLLGIGLTAVVPRWLSMAESVAAVHEQGGLAVVAHPLLPIYIAATAELLAELADGDPRSRPDALEAMHPQAAWLPRWRRRVEAVARLHGYAMVGGSDAHDARSVGRGWTAFDGRTSADLSAAIRAGTTWADGRRVPFRDLFRDHGTR